MLNKLVIDSMRDNFNETFGRLSMRSTYLKEAIENVRKNPGIMSLTQAQRNDIEDELYVVMSASSVLGYYIGLQEGADMIQTLCSGDLPEKLLDAFGELSPYVGQPL